MNSFDIHKNLDNKTSVRNIIIDIINMTASNYNIDVISKCPVIWEHDPVLFISLMFYKRSIQNKEGERLISYTMALWLLYNHELAFKQNHHTFIKEGCYRDCLSMAKMAIDNGNYSNHQIMLILKPMADALIEDTNKINLSIQPNKLNISLASKWAPRKNKSFTVTIPYLKKLCNIKGKNSDMLWRKYIQNISKHYKPTIEHLLSSKQYDMIDFNDVPKKAFNLYKNTFNKIPELHTKYTNFLNNITCNTCNITNSTSTTSTTSTIIGSSIITKYLESNFGLIDKDDILETQWNHVINNNHTSDNYFIPVIDMSGYMFNDCSDISVAMYIAIITSNFNKALYQKHITFSTLPNISEISGDNLCDKINSIYKNITENENNGGDRNGINIYNTYKCLLDYIIDNSITPEIVSKINLLVISNTILDFENMTAGNYSQSVCDNISEQYLENNYTIPKLIYWNLNGPFNCSKHMVNNISIDLITGFDDDFIDGFLNTGNIDNTHFLRISKFRPLVTL